ncbi:MAG: nitroreductase family protein [Butyrivibrio sp.]|nr:nitroreductase family protein [Butyrivibrio sp.]
MMRALKKLSDRIGMICINLRYLFRVARVRRSPEKEALILCHSLEKGMGYSDFSKGHGKEKAKRLMDILSKLREGSYAKDEAVAVLKAYYKAQDDSASLLKLEYEHSSKGYEGGYSTIDMSEITKKIDIDFAGFVDARHSARDLSFEEINSDVVEEAVSMARMAPSACNRQPWKFYYSLKKDYCDVVRNTIPSQDFLQNIPYFGAITSDMSLFDSSETGQWDINGGIFAAYLALSFHSLGIGNCIFQISKTDCDTTALRRKFGIPDSQEIICAVGFGKYKDGAKCLKAARRPIKEIAIEIK